MATTTITELITLNVIQCARCGVHFAITADYERRRRDDGEDFMCPSGHPNVFGSQTLQKRLDAAIREKEQLRLQKEAAERESDRALLQKMEVDVLLNRANKKLDRVKKGVCPCCNRHFDNLEQHMKTKHPEDGKKCVHSKKP